MEQATGRRGSALTLSVAAALLAGCGGPPADQKTTGDPVSSAGERVATDYVRANGGTLDACFKPLPAISGPGGIRTVADNAPAPAAAIDRLVIAIDASGSMAARVGGESKMDAARRAAIAFLRAVPAGTQVGLVAFGHRGTNLPAGKAASCRGVESIYPIGVADAGRVETALGLVRPTGWTPLASAITLAGRSFVTGKAPGAQVVYVVSDGLETCGGDPVAAARGLNRGPVKAIVNIIGFDLTAADRAQLTAVAAAGGGSFVEARTGAELDKAMNALWRKVRAVSAMTGEYFDAGARTTDNNLAVGRYTTDLNLCVAHATSAESTGLGNTLAAQQVAGDPREAALATLRARHERYRTRSSTVAADLLARATTANAAIAAQQRASETRLGVAR